MWSEEDMKNLSYRLNSCCRENPEFMPGTLIRPLRDPQVWRGTLTLQGDEIFQVIKVWDAIKGEHELNQQHHCRAIQIGGSANGDPYESDPYESYEFYNPEDFAILEIWGSLYG